MRRIEIVLGELERLTRGLCLAGDWRRRRRLAEAWVSILGWRNSVSKDLNQLWNDGWQSKAVAARSQPTASRALETLLGRRHGRV